MNHSPRSMNLIHVINNCLSTEKKLIAQVESVSINTLGNHSPRSMNLIHVIKNCLSMEKKLIAQVESVSSYALEKIIARGI